MPAKIYAAPEEIGDPPELDFSDRGDKTIEELMEPERVWVESLQAWCRANGQGELAGEEWRYPRGDGYARYIVYTEKPLALIHVTTGDAWAIDEITRRGLRLTDVRQDAERSKRLAEIFGSSNRRR